MEQTISAHLMVLDPWLPQNHSLSLDRVSYIVCLCSSIFCHISLTVLTVLYFMNYLLRSEPIKFALKHTTRKYNSITTYPHSTA